MSKVARHDLCIAAEASSGYAEAELWLNECPIVGHGDSTGTLSAFALVNPLAVRLIDEIEERRR